MNAAQPLFVQEDARSIRAMREPITLPPGRPREPHDGRTIGGNAVSLRPTLLDDPLPLGFSDFNQVLSAAPAATVTAPVLNDRELERRSH
jgi:hypothetical protein